MGSERKGEEEREGKGGQEAAMGSGDGMGNEGRAGCKGGKVREKRREEDEGRGKEWRKWKGGR